jgi:hypothetical protein
MSDLEKRSLEALKVYLRAVRAYNAMIDTPEWMEGKISTDSAEYIDKANAMDDALSKLDEIAMPLIWGDSVREEEECRQ